MHPRVKEQQLEEKFADCGAIEGVNIIYEPFTRESRGFGFVTFKNSGSALEAVQKFDKTELMDRTVAVQLSKRGRARTKTPGRYLGSAKASVQYGRDRGDGRRCVY